MTSTPPAGAPLTNRQLLGHAAGMAGLLSLGLAIFLVFAYAGTGNDVFTWCLVLGGLGLALQVVAGVYGSRWWLLLPVLQIAFVIYVLSNLRFGF